MNLKKYILALLLILFSSINVTALSRNICIDTDASKETPETKRGYISTLEGIFWDECNDDILIERTCSNGKAGYIEIECQKGCNRGACSKYALFKSSRLKLPWITQLESVWRRNNGKTISDYEIERLDLDEINTALRDIDKRVSLIEANLPELSVFPIVIEANGNKFKVTSNKGEVIIEKVTLMIAEMATDAELEEGEMKLEDFYKQISESKIETITKKGRALILIAKN